MTHDENIGFEVRTLGNMLFRQLLMYMSRRDIDEVTLMHGWIMRYLYDNPDKDIYQKDIEAHFSISRSTVTGILKLMEKKGYVIRESVPQDARLKRLVLTKKGEILHLQTVEDINYLEQAVREGIDPKELEIFFKVIAQLKRNIEHSDILKEEDKE